MTFVSYSFVIAINKTEPTALASLWSTGNAKPGNSGMTIQHFQGVRSRCARMMRDTSASPIRFSTLTSFTTVLQWRQYRALRQAKLPNSRGNEELVLDVHEMIRHLDCCAVVSTCIIRTTVRDIHSPFKYAFWMECSIRSGVPMDQGPAERQICSSHVPVRPISASSPGLNSGGGSKNGMVREWFCAARHLAIVHPRAWRTRTLILSR